jgi:hypothetical protein
MGAIGGMLGLGGGASGTGFNAPSGVALYNPAGQANLSGAQTGVNNSMAQQQALLQALQSQNALANQNQVYGQLQGIAAGTGPNPAQTMLNQATGQNVANQAALMAGQRGANANVGLIARQAAQQGAQTQQQAAGQAASLQAQQSLNAIGQAGGMANTQAGNLVGQTNANTQAQQAEQAALLQAQNAYNQAQVGMQSSVNAGNTQLANTGMQGQQGLIGGLMNGIGAMFADGGSVGNMPGVTDPNSLDSEVNATATQPVAPAAPTQPMSKFGKFIKGSFGGVNMSGGQSSGVATTGPGALQQGMSSLVSGLGRAFKSDPNAPISTSDNDITGGSSMAGGPADTMGAPAADSGIADVAFAAKGGKVPAMVSPGEQYLKPQEAKAVADGKASPKQVGKIIPGKPKFKGNNYANDVVPANLDEGGVVIPNSVMQSKNPAEGAARFVRAVMAKKGMKK